VWKVKYHMNETKTETETDELPEAPAVPELEDECEIDTEIEDLEVKSHEVKLFNEFKALRKCLRKQGEELMDLHIYKYNFQTSPQYQFKIETKKKGREITSKSCLR
jgi:hypothetical protein